MKQEKNIEVEAKSQTSKASPLPLQRRGGRMQAGNFYPENEQLPNRILLILSAILRSGQGLAFTIGKAPPGSRITGSARSPGAGRGHPPENKAGPPGQARGHPPENKAGPPDQTDVILRPDRFLKPVRSGNEPNILNTISLTFRQWSDITDKHRMQFFKHTFFKFYKHLNFIIMKKQILFLVLFVLAALANVNKSYGACTTSPTAPAIGDTYNYKGEISGGSFTGGGTYLWYVLASTDAGNLLGGTPIGSGTVFTSTLPSANNIDVIWEAPSSGNTYYLVLKYSETIGGCTVNNLKTWEIKPVNTFMLAIGVDPGAEGSGGAYCPANVSAASVSGGVATYNYGTQTMYAEITASNYTGAWTPSFKITGLQGDQAIQNVVWGISAASAATATASAGSGVYTTATNATAAFDGTAKIYLKFEIVNNTWETTATETITIAVDGVIPGATPIDDVKADCSAAAAWSVTHDQTIKPRPTITGTPTTL